GDDRSAARHGLHQDGAEALPPGRQDEHRRTTDPGPGILDKAWHHQSRPEAELARQRFEAAALSALAQDDHGDVRMARRSHGPQQEIEALLPMQATTPHDEPGRN